MTRSLRAWLFIFALGGIMVGQAFCRQERCTFVVDQGKLCSETTVAPSATTCPNRAFPLLQIGSSPPPLPQELLEEAELGGRAAGGCSVIFSVKKTDWANAST